MKKINSKGFKISNPDKIVLEYYLLDSPEEWAQKALKGMINKATKTILKDWIDVFKDKSVNSIAANYSELIPAIIAMDEFKPYNISSIEKNKAQRDEPQDIEIWSNGFDVEDWEDAALRAYYIDPEQTLSDFMENKIALRKEAFTKEHEKQLLNDTEVKTIPSRHDALINLVTQKEGYKNRREKEVLN